MEGSCRSAPVDQHVLLACTVGHVKFSPDWCYGLLKQQYRRTFISILQDVADIIATSSDINTAQLVGTQNHNGDIIVSTYDWATFLSSHFRKVTHLKSYHHFTFATSHPGLVILKSLATQTAVPWLPDAERRRMGTTGTSSTLHNACRALERKTVVLIPANS